MSPISDETRKPDAILVVDDEKSIRITLKRILEREGYYVETAPDFASAKKNIENLSFDLFILDIILPTINGIEFLEILRKDMGIGAPVIFITGEPNIQTAVDALRLGAYDYIEKPIRKHDLLKVIKHAIDRRRLEKEIEVHELRNELVEELLHEMEAPLRDCSDILTALRERGGEVDLESISGVAAKLEACIEDFKSRVAKIEKAVNVKD
ncbi:MAG: response regulator [Promethearchaeota archaeon]